MQETNLLAAALFAVITLGFSGLSQAQTRADRYDAQIDRLAALTSDYDSADCATTPSAACEDIAAQMERALDRLAHLTSKHDWAADKLSRKSNRLVVLRKALDRAEDRFVQLVRNGEGGSDKAGRVKSRLDDLRTKINRLQRKVAKLNGLM